MRKAFDLTFPTSHGDFRFGITLEKSFQPRISLNRGFNGKPVKQIQVLPKDPKVDRITDIKQIDQIVQYSDLQSLWPTKDQDSDGNPVYVVIDKNSLKNAFPSSRVMRVIQVVPRNEIPIHKLEGSHYFMCIEKVKKGKTRVINPDDEELYNMVWHGLDFNGESLVVSYSVMNNIKCGLITATEENGLKVLRLSNMIGDNHQKKVKEPQPVRSKSTEQDRKRFDKLVQSKRKGGVPTYTDEYSDKLKEVIQCALKGETVKGVELVKRSVSSRLAILDDSDDEEMVIVSKKRTVSAKK